MWPGEEFGAPGIAVDEEMDVMRELLMNPVAGMLISIVMLMRPVELCCWYVGHMLVCVVMFNTCSGT